MPAWSLRVMTALTSSTDVTTSVKLDDAAANTADDGEYWEPSFECTDCEKAWTLLGNGIDPRTVYVDEWCKEHVPRCVCPKLPFASPSQSYSTVPGSCLRGLL